MNQMTLQRPLGEPLHALATHRLRSRFGDLLTATGLCLLRSEKVEEAIANGFHVDRRAGVVVTATSSSRPFYFHECELLSQLLQLDLVLLRSEGPTEVSFDVLLAGSDHWLCNFHPWRDEASDFWLVPARYSEPYFRLSGRGLEALNGAPFANEHARIAGIVPAIERQTLGGRI